MKSKEQIASLKRELTHKLKCDSAPFRAMVAGLKTFEVRKNDRNFKVNDRLFLEEFHEGRSTNSCLGGLRIKYILDGGQYGIEDGYVVLGLDTSQMVLEKPFI